MSELPSNTQIHAEMVGGKMRVTIFVTLESARHASALIEAINQAVIPILQIAQSQPTSALQRLSQPEVDR